MASLFVAIATLELSENVCGRFTLRAPASSWCQLFLIDPVSLEEANSREEAEAIERPRFNIAPTQSVPCVIEQPDQPRTLRRLRWGLIPSWSDNLAIGNRLINARGETIDSKPSFRQAFALRRCLIPTDGYYEWKKVVDGKQPYLIHRSDNGVMAMAGVWEENTKASADGTIIGSFTVITTSANQTTMPIHDRMPVFVEPADFQRWLDPHEHDASNLKAMLRPAREDLLRFDAVSRRVNSPKHDDESCVAPISSKTLFD